MVNIGDVYLKQEKREADNSNQNIINEDNEDINQDSSNLNENLNALNNDEEINKAIRELQKRKKSFKKRLDLEKSDKENLRVGIRNNGTKYSVRTHRGEWLLPAHWIKFFNALKLPKQIITFDLLIQTGARINEIRHIEERDIDYERNTIRLRVTKTKAKKGEEIGKPRTIPVNSACLKRLRKHFRSKKPGSKVGILSTPGANMALKKGLDRAHVPNHYMYSIHNLRKTHGNWLKILGNLKIMNVDAMEICLRLGHSFETFLKDYGSSGIMDSRDVQIVQQVLGDLYH